MNEQRLQSITISNFRSIAGEIRVPLDAPVVLIHGMNGVGKTSVLSALEFGLTGSVDSLRRVDKGYESHLVRRGERSASITIDMNDSNGSAQFTRTYEGGTWRGVAPLQGSEASHFSERCYLAQSTLGRLLEIYETSSIGPDSALARFVKDVLRLDTIDSLMAGLRASGDVRRIRTLVPGFAELERNYKDAQIFQEAREQEFAATLAEAKRLRDVTRDTPNQQTSVASSATGSLDDESLLESLVASRREVAGVRARLLSAMQDSNASGLADIEMRASNLAADVDAWWRQAGTQLETTLTAARALFTDIPSARVAGPEAALEVALARIGTQFAATERLLSADDDARNREQQLHETMELLAARRTRIAEQESAIGENTSEIGRLLAELVPHLEGDDCLLCGRSFSEVSEEPLAAVVLRRASQLATQAQTLSDLAKAGKAALTQFADASREQETVRAQKMTTTERSVSISLLASLRSWRTDLDRLRTPSAAAAAKIGALTELQRDVSMARANEEVTRDSRTFIDTLRLEYGFAPMSSDDATLHAVDEVDAAIVAATSNAESRLEARRAWDEQQALMRAIEDQLSRKRSALADARKRAKSLATDISEVERRYELARLVLKAAGQTQADIVESVFNESLNAIWRELFVRLAPSEAFVPAFEVSPGASTPNVITKHRDGAHGGSPGAMLSAGNLNTAALTLFLALHLHAPGRMPVLVLDDPVQSMDDVHISQLAALLRVLSKQLGRQIIIAVHERALFDYLQLELSPAFPGDAMIAVELKKMPDGGSHAEPTYFSWKADDVRIAQLGG